MENNFGSINLNPFVKYNNDNFKLIKISSSLPIPKKLNSVVGQTTKGSLGSPGEPKSGVLWSWNVKYNIRDGEDGSNEKPD